MEIACDESGSEGERLIGGETDVFAHASVRLSTASAAACIAEARDRIRSPVQEYKANHLLREKHRAVLEWLLEPAGPIFGNAHVHLTDKAFFMVGRIAELVGEDSTGGRALYRDGPRIFGRDRFESFLEAFNNLMRGHTRRGAETTAEEFRAMAGAMHRASPPGRVREIMARLSRVTPSPAHTLDPLLPAIVAAVAYWSEAGEPVSIVHDQQLALTEERILRLKNLTGGRLTSLTLVDSRFDPRVQVADFLAGIARKIASNELNGRGEQKLTELLRPYVDSASTWA